MTTNDSNLNATKKLLELAREFEKKGDAQSALKTYEYALFQLPEDSTLRKEIELTIELHKGRHQSGRGKNRLWIIGIASLFGLVLLGVGALIFMRFVPAQATETATPLVPTDTQLPTEPSVSNGTTTVAFSSELSPTPTIIILTIKASKVTLKAGPDNKHPDLPYLFSEGTEMIVLEKYKEWYYVQGPDGETGWLHYQWVTIDPSLAGEIPISNNIPTIPPNYVGATFTPKPREPSYP